jgi:hypothetical protein
MKKLISFAGFGLSQLLLFFYTIDVLVNTPKENVTKKTILIIIACTWFFFFAFAVYKLIFSNKIEK